MVCTKARNAAGLLNDQFQTLAAEGERRTFKPGEVIFSAGDEGDGSYLVVAGRVRISAVVGSNESRVLATLGPGDFFGEMAVLDDAPRSATATAETRTRTLFIQRGKLLDLLGRQPGLALGIIREFSARMRSLNQKYVEEVMQAERLAVIGRFATTIVHDFKAPLAVIGLATDLACSRGCRYPVRRQTRVMVSRQIERMTTMLHELIDFTRPCGRKADWRNVAFARYLRGLGEEMSDELLQRGIRLAIEPPPRGIRTRIEPQRLSRLFYNLLNNAADEMQDGGEVCIQCSLVGDVLQVDVRDNGRGIAPEIATSIFNPFVTYGKPQGTGLGLAICRKIAEDHGGRIWATSTPGKGATFSFTLPLAVGRPVGRV